MKCHLFLPISPCISLLPLLFTFSRQYSTISLRRESSFVTWKYTSLITQAIRYSIFSTKSQKHKRPLKVLSLAPCSNKDYCQHVYAFCKPLRMDVIHPLCWPAPMLPATPEKIFLTCQNLPNYNLKLSPPLSFGTTGSTKPSSTRPNKSSSLSLFLVAMPALASPSPSWSLLAGSSVYDSCFQQKYPCL